MTAELGGAARALRTPRSAAVAGIVFSVLLVAVLVIIRMAEPADAATGVTWLDDPSRRRLVLFALNLVPFAGIAFLWFIGAVRDHVGDAEDRFFATVFLGSGFLFVAMLFVGAAMAAGLTETIDSTSSSAETVVWQLNRRTSVVVITVYAMRMAGVFIISTTSITDRLGAIPRWLTIYGYGSALVLLLTVGTVRWIELLFPVWAFVLSVHLLRTRFRTDRAVRPENEEPRGGLDSG